MSALPPASWSLSAPHRASAGQPASDNADENAKEPPAKSERKIPWSQAVEGLQCWQEPEKAVWKASDVPSFQLHVRDLGKRDLEIHTAQDACKLEFDGAWYDWTAPVSILSGNWPAGRQHDDFEVRVTLDPRWGTEKKPLALKPGKHKIRVAYVTLDSKKPVRIESNLVEIEVTE